MKKALIILVLLISLMLLGIEVQINLDHLEFLRDHFAVEGESEIGYWIYADRLPDGNYRHADAPGEGVTCVDDVARAAVLYLRLFEISGMEQHYDRAKEALEFVLSMQDSDGDFYNFVFEDGSINRNGPTSRKGGNWWAARALYALAKGARVSQNLDPEFSMRLADAAQRCFRKIIGFERDGLIQGYTDLSSVVLLGAAELYSMSNDALLGGFIKRCAAALQSKVIQNEDSIFNGLVDESSPSEPRYFWHGWGSRQLEALAVAGEILGDDSLLEISTESFKQSSLLLINAGPLYSISSYLQLFPQIAYAAESAISAGFRLYHLTGDRDFAAITALLGSWFLGVNKLNQSMVGKNGEGFDGLEFSHVNKNAGAESTISMLLSLERIKRLPEEYGDLFSAAIEVLTPVVVLEAESMRAGLSESEIIQSTGVSGSAVTKISGAFSLRQPVTLVEASYSVFAAINEAKTNEVVFTLRMGESKSEKTIRIEEKTVQKLGVLKGNGKETTLTVGGKVSEGSFDIDQIILVPDIVAVYLVEDDVTIVFNFKGCSEFDEGVSVIDGRVFEREKSVLQVQVLPVSLIEMNGFVHLDLLKYFDNNGIATSDERKTANFDNPQGQFGASYISSELEKAIDSGFLAVEDTEFMVNVDGNDNFRLTGQALTFSAEMFDKICILGAANHGDYTGEALLIYEDDYQQVIPLSFSDWCGGPSTGEKIAFEFSGRYDNTGNTERIKCMLYYRCINLLEKPLKGIVLPQMPNVHVFAISLSRAEPGSQEE